MSRSNERATHRHSVHHLKHPLPAPPIAQQAMEGPIRCQRPQCGGLMLLRVVVTVDGTCEEVVCSACSRSQLVRIVEPYQPLPEGDPLTQEIVARLSVGQGSDDTEDIELPPAVLDVVRSDGGFGA